MAATLDATIGTKAQASAATASLVTSAAAAAGSLVVVGVGFFASAGAGETASITTAGGLTWVATTKTSSGSIHGYLFYAYAPAGLASGTTLTWSSGTANVCDWLIGGASFLGMETTPTLLGQNGAAASSTAWSGGSIVAGEVNLSVLMAFEDGAGTATSTTTAPASELIDFNNAGQAEAFTLAYNLAGASTATMAGTWSASVSHVTRAAAFRIASAAATEIPILVMAPPIPT